MRNRLRPRPSVRSAMWPGPRSDTGRPSWWSPDSSSWWPHCFGGNVTSKLSRGGFDAPSEQSVHAAHVLASEFHDGSDNILILVHALIGHHRQRTGGVVPAPPSTRQLAAQPHVANVMSYWSLRPRALAQSQPPGRLDRRTHHGRSRPGRRPGTDHRRRIEGRRRHSPSPWVGSVPRSMKLTRWWSATCSMQRSSPYR